MARILIIDDQQDILDLMVGVFESEDYEVEGVADGSTARERIVAGEYDVVFTDLRLGYPFDGLEMLELVKQNSPRTQVVIMTAFSSVESSVLAMKAGAYDYITKPFTAEEVLLLAARATERAQLTDQARLAITGTELEPVGATSIVGQSPALMRVMRLVGQVARTDATVLVLGESGTGKELVARAIHQLSPRVKECFVAVNCGAIPETLQESEFFGHVKGSFTGAIRDKVGLFAQANKGTLFLDEVGEMSLGTQVKLLRFLQQGEIRRIGDNEPGQVDARVLAATNRDLEAMIRDKTFREDLYYRLNIIAVEVPPLRERVGDVDILARYFLAKKSRKLGRGVVGFTPEAMAKLTRYTWPGNVRELENAIERAVTLAGGTLVDTEDLPRLDRRSDLSPPVMREFQVGEGARPSAPIPVLVPAESIDPEVDAFPSLDRVEREHILRALRQFGGNRSRTSKALGISKATLWRKIKSYELDI
ncbi:MAG: sigma-54 dependent transcriptional regulator [Myxococcota bacterium]|nr:sigma-54 dependent transcriptional regulator [Myxococcota bacterium]